METRKYEYGNFEVFGKFERCLHIAYGSRTSLQVLWLDQSLLKASKITRNPTMIEKPRFVHGVLGLLRGFPRIPKDS